MVNFWLDLQACGECGADSSAPCLPYCTAPENRTGKVYVMNFSGKNWAALKLGVIVAAVPFALFVAAVLWR